MRERRAEVGLQRYGIERSSWALASTVQRLEWSRRTGDAKTLAATIAADKAVAAKQYGIPAGVGIVIPVRFTGPVGEGKSGIYHVAVNGPPLEAKIRVRAGRAISGTDLCDATGEIQLGQFEKQIEYATTGAATPALLPVARHRGDVVDGQDGADLDAVHRRHPGGRDEAHHLAGMVALHVEHVPTDRASDLAASRAMLDLGLTSTRARWHPCALITPSGISSRHVAVIDDPLGPHHRPRLLRARPSCPKPSGLPACVAQPLASRRHTCQERPMPRASPMV